MEREPVQGESRFRERAGSEIDRAGSGRESVHGERVGSWRESRFRDR